ncbi:MULTISPECIES: VanZ family protein [Actinomyces]|uniref:VanZ family protein n=1 Tax=Actinomyces TaxID=1654 RepID=UPI001E33CCC7|nr:MULTISPECIES: VanZ family protein [Actinomyces]
MPAPMTSHSSRVGAPSTLDSHSAEVPVAEAALGDGLPLLGPDRLAVPGHAHRPGPRRRAARALAVLYGIIVLMAVLWPSGGDIATTKGLLGPFFLGEAGKDIVLNLVMLAPLTAILTLAWPRVPWWAWALLGCLIGAGAELAQALIPALDRRPSPANAAQNAVGSWCGAAIGLIVSRLIERRSRS